MLEVQVASIAKRMFDISGIQKIYFDEVEEGFKRPSLYFPPVEQTVTGDTLTTFAYDNAMFVKVFDKTTKLVMEKANQITHAILSNRNLIPIVDEIGQPTGDKFRLRDTSYRAIDIGTAQLYIRWKSSYPYTTTTYTKASQFTFNILLKE